MPPNTGLTPANVQNVTPMVVVGGGESALPTSTVEPKSVLAKTILGGNRRRDLSEDAAKNPLGGLGQKDGLNDTATQWALDQLEPELRERLSNFRGNILNEELQLKDAIKELRDLKTRANNANPKNYNLINATRLLEKNLLHFAPLQLAAQLGNNPNLTPLLLDADVLLSTLSQDSRRLTSGQLNSYHQSLRRILDKLIKAQQSNPNEIGFIRQILEQKLTDLEENIKARQRLIALQANCAVAESIGDAVAFLDFVPLDKDQCLRTLTSILDNLAAQNIDVTETRAKLNTLGEKVPDRLGATGPNSLDQGVSELLVLIAKKVIDSSVLNPAQIATQMADLQNQILARGDSGQASVYQDVGKSIPLQEKFAQDLETILSRAALNQLAEAMTTIKSEPIDEAAVSQAIADFTVLADYSGLDPEAKNMALEFLRLGQELARLNNSSQNLDERNNQLAELQTRVANLKSTMAGWPDDRSPIQTVRAQTLAQTEVALARARSRIQDRAEQLLTPYANLESEVGDLTKLSEKEPKALENLINKLAAAASEAKPARLGATEIGRLNHRLMALLAAVENELLAKSLNLVGVVKGEAFTTQEIYVKINNLPIGDADKKRLLSLVDQFSHQKKAALTKNLNVVVEKFDQELNAKPPKPWTKEAVARSAARVNQQLSHLESLARYQLRGQDLTNALADLEATRINVNQRIADLAIQADERLNGLVQGDESRRLALKQLFLASENNVAIWERLASQPSSGSLLTDIAALRKASPGSEDEKTLAKKVLSQLYDLVINQPELQEVTLQMAKAILGQALTSEAIEANHEALVTNYNLFHLMSSSKAGAEILSHSEVSGPKQLDHQKRHTLLFALSPADFSQTNFNVLLAKSLWNEFRIVPHLDDSGVEIKDPDALMALFIASYPALKAIPLDQARVYLNLDYHQIADLDETASWIQRASSEFFVDQEMEKMVDTFLASDPQYAARRARDVVLRKVANSVGVTYDPTKPAVEQIQNLTGAITERANALGEANRQSFRGRLGSLWGAEGGYAAQTRGATELYAQNLPTYQKLSQQRARALKSERDLTADLAQRATISNQDLAELGQLTFDKSTAPTETEIKALSHPTLFLHYQGAYLPPEGVIPSKVSGEIMALRLAAFNEVLAGRVKVPGAPGQPPRDMNAKEMVMALKGVSIPKHFSLHEMKSHFKDLSGVVSDHQGEKLLDLMRKIKRLDPKAPDFASQFEPLKKEFEQMALDYQLAEKADLILAFGSTTEANQNHSQEFDPIEPLPINARRERTKGAIATSLAKMWGGQAKFAARKDNPLTNQLYQHLLNAKTNVRGEVEDLRTARDTHIADQRSDLASQRAMLERVEEKYSQDVQQFLDDLTTVAVFSAFDALGLKDFNDAANQISSAANPLETPLYQKSLDILTRGAGLTDAQAHHILQLRLVNPILSSQDGGAEVFEGLYNRASPSKANRQQLLEMSPEARQARLALETRQRNEAVLDQLSPGEAIDFSSGVTKKVGGSLRVGTRAVTGVAGLVSANGLAISHNADGSLAVTMTNGTDFRLGLGYRADALWGNISLRGDFDHAKAKGLTFTFENRENCLLFLDSLMNGNYSNELVERTAKNIQVIMENETTGALHGELVSDNSAFFNPYYSASGCKFYPGSVEFVVSGDLALARREETERDAQAETVTTTWTGSIGLGASASASLAETPQIFSVDEEEGRIPHAALQLAGQIGEAARETREVTEANAKLGQGGAGLTTDGSVRQVYGMDYAAVTESDRGHDFNQETLKHSWIKSFNVSLAATSTTTVERSRLDGRLTGAAQGLKVNFTGDRSVANLRQYLTHNLRLDAAKVDQIVAYVDQQIKSGATRQDFTIQARYSLTAEAKLAINAPNLSPEERAVTSERIIKDSANYELSQLRFTGERGALAINSVNRLVYRRDQTAISHVEIDLMTA
ncbi:MAG: hypothetical protein LBT86_06120 [Deltaproteobacteria bacterium]|jgi:hypothetical protein|nr:hypothetical protein [Deltaproteobacteria bacterium]